MPSKVVSHAADACSTLLSRESSPPIDDVIAAGIVPQLAKFLYRHDSPALQYEAAWTLTNISSGTHEQTASVVESGAVPQVSSWVLNQFSIVMFSFLFDFTACSNADE